MCIQVISNYDQTKKSDYFFFFKVSPIMALFAGYIMNLLKIKRRTTQVHGKHTKGPPRSYNQEPKKSRKSNEGYKDPTCHCFFLLSKHLLLPLEKSISIKFYTRQRNSGSLPLPKVHCP
jgi:hypothetical protein